MYWTVKSRLVSIGLTWFLVSASHTYAARASAALACTMVLLQNTSQNQMIRWQCNKPLKNTGNDKQKQTKWQTNYFSLQIVSQHENLSGKTDFSYRQKYEPESKFSFLIYSIFIIKYQTKSWQTFFQWKCGRKEELRNICFLVGT